MIGVIKDDEPTKYSRDASRKPQAVGGKGKERKTCEIESLTHLIKNFTT